MKTIVKRIATMSAAVRYMAITAQNFPLIVNNRNLV